MFDSIRESIKVPFHENFNRKNVCFSFFRDQRLPKFNYKRLEKPKIQNDFLLFQHQAPSGQIEI